MIQIYDADNTEYGKNGDEVLLPSRAYVHAILNGAWEAVIEHPIDHEGCWKHIVDGAVVKMPSFNGQQLFRIKKSYKADSGIEAELDPIFYDAADDCFLVDIRPTGKNGQQALDLMMAPNAKYKGTSDISDVSTAYYMHKNLIEALNGEENAFTQRWGGEILYDNFHVTVNKRVGGDYGVSIRYGKNIEQDGLTEEVDIRDVVTRIYPKSYNGHLLSGTGYVDSPLINNYPVVKTRTITFEDVKLREDASDGDEEEGVTICDTQDELDAALIQKCQDQFTLGLDRPSVTIEAAVVLLKGTSLYDDYSELEDVSLGDTVHCRHTRLGITTDARVCELQYDSIRKKVESVKIGDFSNSVFEKLASSASRIEKVIDASGNVVADRVAGILNGIRTQLRIQSTAAKKVEGRAFCIEDLDPESALFGAMVWGTQGLQISTRRTQDGKDWDWTTAVTANGIVADAILTGLLADKTGTNYWNLDTGEFALTSAAKVQTTEGEVSLADWIKTQSEASKNLQVIVTRDLIGVPVGADGHPDFENASVTVRAMYGDEDVSDQCTYTITESGVSGAWDKTNAAYTVTSMQTDSGSVRFSVSYKSVLTAQRIVQVQKIKDGKDAGYRYLSLSVQVAKKAGGKIVPGAVEISALQQDAETAKAYEGRLKIETTSDGSTWAAAYESADDESSHAYTLPDVAAVRVSLFAAGGTEQLLDVRNISIVQEADALTSDDVFNLLTKGGQIQGLFRIGDQIYINASYLRSGTYTVGGAKDERGSIQILDESGNVAGIINSSGVDVKNLQIGDRIIIYDASKKNSVSIGFENDLENGTSKFWISGVQVTMQDLYSAAATFGDAAITSATIQNLTVSENLISNGDAQFVTLGVSGEANLSDTQVVGKLVATQDIVAGGYQSLLEHTHQYLKNGTRQLILDNTGSVQHVRTFNNGSVTTNDVNLGSNASKFKAVYATNGTIQTSDERKKDIISGMDERYIQFLQRLKPILYRWKENDNGLHAGFGAQQFEQALKDSGFMEEEEFAVINEEGEMGLQYSEVIPVLVYAVQKLIEERRELQ
ncbi:MAG: phage tail protein [Lachnospiraceae bacterium]|nr:phage tail protein [Lachnospiraceae bacterium]